MASIKDVARLAGVSPQTVSNYFNKPAIVKAATRSTVKTAVESLGYRPNASARRLRMRRSNTIAIGIEPSGYSQIYDRLLHALVGAADAHGLRVLLYNTDSKADEIRQFVRLTSGADVDCFVLANTIHDDPRIFWMLEHNQSFVLFGRPWGHPAMEDPNIAWVDVNGQQGIADMTRHLVGTGHRRIGFLGWPDPSGTGMDRRLGWEQTMISAGLAGRTELYELQEQAQDTIGNGQRAGTTLLSRRPDLDAIVCVSDTLAMGALMAVGGRDVTVTGFDDSDSSRSLGFPSVQQPVRDIADEIVRLIVEQLSYAADRHLTRSTRHALLPPTLAIH